MNDFDKDHAIFWRTLQQHDVGTISSPEATATHPAVAKPQPTSKVFFTNVKYLLGSTWYILVRRCPYVFFTVWLPLTLLLEYFIYNYLVYIIEAFSLSKWILACHVIIAFPTWIILTCISLPAGSSFENERPRNKIVVASGVYYSKEGLMAKIAKCYNPKVMQRYESGRDHEATPWIIGPDSQTMWPFIFANLKLGAFRLEPKYDFVHIPMKDRDRIPLGWSFPTGGYTNGSTVLIVLHGLNGGAHSSMVVDTVVRATAKGWTVCAPAQRGVSRDAPIKNQIFNGIDSVEDLHEIARVVRDCCPDSLIIAAGYSMGGLTVSNYAGTYGTESRIDGFASVAGCLDASEASRFTYAHNGYFPMIASRVKGATLSCPMKVAILQKRGLDIDYVQECKYMLEWDTRVSARVTSSESVADYYNRISLAPSDSSHSHFGKEKKVAVPLVCVQARNDTAFDVNSMDVTIPVRNHNIMFVVTEHGGHCGWPLGWWPTLRGHERQTSFVMDFVEAMMRHRAADGSAPSRDTTAGNEY